MGHILFERIEKAGFIRGTTLNRSAIEHASPVDILDFALASCEFTSAKHIQPDTTLFAHSASLSLGAGRWPCGALPCRLDRAERLAQFAALYSDKVYIRNVFAEYVERAHHKQLPDESSLQLRFAEDLGILLYLRPFIESQRVVPITPPYYCLHCLAKHSLGLTDERPLQKAIRWLERRMENEVQVEVSRHSAEFYLIEATGPDDLLEHGHRTITDKAPPPSLQMMPRISARVMQGKPVHLSRWALRNLDFGSLLASNHVRSILFELTLAQCLRTGFLTEMPLHIAFLKRLSSQPPQVERDFLVERHLTCLLPFLKELSPTEVLKLRQTEGDAFILFKSALAEAVNEYRRDYGRFTEADARALYSDVLKPKLAELEMTISKARRSLIKGSVRKVLAWTAAISFGVYAGLLPQGLAAAAAGLGLTKVLADVTEDLMAKSDIEESARGQSMYFLWKIKKTARSKRTRGDN